MYIAITILTTCTTDSTCYVTGGRQHTHSVSGALLANNPLQHFKRGKGKPKIIKRCVHVLAYGNGRTYGNGELFTVSHSHQILTYTD